MNMRLLLPLPELLPMSQVAPAGAGDPAIALLAALSEAAWVVDGARGTVLAANESAQRFFDRGPLAGTWAEEVIETLEDSAYWAEAREGGLEGGARILETDAEIVGAQGEMRRVTRRIAPLALADGRCLFLVQVRDRTREHRIERERETALAELRATLEATADAILVTSLSGGIRAFNRRFAALWALPDTLLQGGDDRAVQQWLRMSVMDVDAYDRRLEEVYAHTLAEAHDTLALVNGALIERHAQPQWSQGRPIGRVMSYRELNPRRVGAPREPGAEGIEQATRLPNRTGFLRSIEDALRTGPDAPGFAVLCLEFDRDALFGEGDGTAGARRLSELAEQVRAAMRQPHRCARLAGSRFGVLLPDASEAAAEAAARRLIEQQAQAGGVRVSIGISCHPGAGLSADEIIRHAEIALHAAQQDIGCALKVHRFGFEPWRRRRDQVEEGLRHAADEGRFRLVHQPRFEGADLQATSIEVHLRWRDRELGEVAPAQFLSVAEERGLTGALDDWALEQGLFHARRWRAAGHGWRLNVNVSGWQLVQPGYARRVAAALAAAEWPADALEIDVTEDALVADPEAAVAAVRALTRQGVRVLLDAFDGGATALALLRRLPLAGVKLDASLAQASVRSDVEAAWVSALVDLVHALRLEVHATGVDSLPERLALRAAGCDGLQGRACGPWMDEKSLDHWVGAASIADPAE